MSGEKLWPGTTGDTERLLAERSRGGCPTRSTEDKRLSPRTHHKHRYTNMDTGTFLWSLSRVYGIICGLSRVYSISTVVS